MNSVFGVTRIFFKDFTKNTNIHGLRYFNDGRLHWSERLWWLISLGLSLWLSGSMIRDVWIQWNTPFIDSSEGGHVSMVPFPTVTICPEIKNLKHKFEVSSKFDKNSKLIANLSDIEDTKLNALAHVCPILSSKIESKDEFTDKSIYKIIEDLAPYLEYTIKECWWQQKKINCSEYISPEFIRQGLCFQFNGLHFNDMYTNETASHALVATNNRKLSHWTLESGYEEPVTDDEYPVRLFGSSSKEALELVLSSKVQDRGEYFCSGLRQGFMVALNVPSESVESKGFLLADFSENALITVKPKLTTTSKELKSWKLLKRGCFLNSERRLRFFKTYTQPNCMIECLSNLTKILCGCVGFYMPRDANTKVCGAAKIECYKECEEKMRFKLEFSRKCYCPPSCTSVQYEAKSDQAKFFTKTFERQRNLQMNHSSELQTRLAIFYNAKVISIENRKELYTVGEFLAICGGLLGLFFGVSLLSVVELVYYSTLRFFWTIYRPRSERKDEQSERSEIDEQRIDGKSSIWQNRMVQALFRVILKIQPFFIEFCDNSNMHGFRYFSKRFLHWSERLFWLMSFSVSLWWCGSMTRNVWIKWAEDPVTIISEKYMELGSLSLPTVSICPDIKATKDKLDVTAALNSLSNLSDIGWTRLNALAHICPQLPHLISYRDNFTNESIYDTIQDISPNIKQSAMACHWRGRLATCFQFITPVLTGDGLCFTFNALNSHEIYTNEMAPGMMIVKNNLNTSGWSLDSGYANQSDERNYPIQMFHAKHSNLFKGILAINQNDIDYQCRGCGNGFKLIFSMPGEVVETTQNYLRLSSFYHNIFDIHLKIITTSEGLRGYTPNQRQCFYSSDHPLRFFKIYTKKNCEAECLANFTAIECGCVKFSMPRDINTKICGGANVKCYETAHRNLFTSKRGEIFRKQCNCWPSCTSIEYTATTYRTSFDDIKLKQLNRVPNNIKFSILIFAAKRRSTEIKKRKEMYNFTDLLAACGGMLGLFLGVSALSIVEIIYHLTLRLFWTIRMKRSNRVDLTNNMSSNNYEVCVYVQNAF